MQQIGESTEKGAEKSTEKILILIKENKDISARELSKIIGISQRAVEKHISNLKKKGRLKRVGPAKGGYWKVMEDKTEL